MIRHTALTVAEMFDVINDEPAATQLPLIDSYIRERPPLCNLLRMYLTEPFFDFSTATYRQPKHDGAPSSVVKLADRLMLIVPAKTQVSSDQRFKAFELIMESITQGEMMWMENFITKSLESTYPNVDWAYIKRAVVHGNS